MNYKSNNDTKSPWNEVFLVISSLFLFGNKVSLFAQNKEIKCEFSFEQAEIKMEGTKNLRLELDKMNKRTL